MECLRSGQKCQRYSENIRRFCLTLQFYSPKAYEYLRSTFNQNLPAQRTIRSWYSSLDCSPGFTESAFSALRQRADDAKANGEELLVGLIFDGMSMRKHSQFNRATKQFMGHNTAGNSNTLISGEEVCTPIATDAMVFMVSGINKEFKIPIAYFLSTGLNANELVELLNEALKKLKETGVKVVSFTFDGHPTNISAVKKLGANFILEKPYFENPYDEGYNVYMILDACHMLKLARNCLGSKGILVDQNDKEVKWKLFSDLVMLQIDENINLGNKLTKSHIEYENNKMNVRIAVQTLSNSSADSIEYIDRVLKIKSFADSEGTTAYFRMFNNLFDIMNSKRKHTKGGFKRPFSDTSISDFISCFNDAKVYLRGLKIIQDEKKNSILKSKSHTPFKGFLNNMTSFICIYNEYIKKFKCDEFYTFAVSQDLLESFFGCIRRMGSTNDNPTAQQFTAAYRKLLFHNEVSSSDGSNCENDVTKVLTVSSKAKSTILQADPDDLKMLADYDFLNLDVIDPIERCDETHSDVLHENSLVYLAGIVEANVIRKLVRKGKKGCKKCMETFTENEITLDDFIDFKIENGKNVIQPCESTMKIIHIVEKFLEKYDSENIKISFSTIIAHIMQNIDTSQLYASSQFDETHNHKDDLVKLVMEEYMDLQSMQFGRRVTRLTQKKLIRHDRLKLVHLAGQ